MPEGVQDALAAAMLHAHQVCQGRAEREELGSVLCINLYLDCHILLPPSPASAASPQHSLLCSALT